MPMHIRTSDGRWHDVTAESCQFVADAIAQHARSLCPRSVPTVRQVEYWSIVYDLMLHS